MTVNNITRFLESRCIPYESFELPAEKLGAVETACLLKVPEDQVYKSIVFKSENTGKPMIAMIPGNKELDLKLAAKAVGEKKVILTTLAEAEKLTGMQAGGISPLGLLNCGFKFYIDEEAILWEKIHISGGQRGLNLLLAVDDLVKITGASYAQLSRSVPG
jgi:Cys-tRNA(Pro)/Cys-tRNA(Cys) deacylase